MPCPAEHNQDFLTTDAPTGRAGAQAGLDSCCAPEQGDFFEAAGVGMAEVDPETMRFLRVNRKFCQLTGRSAEELLGLTFLDITHPDDRFQNTAIHARLQAGEQDEYAARKRYLRPDGSSVWVQVNVSALGGEGGHPRLTLAIAQEIGDLKRKEHELLQSAGLNQRIIDSSLDCIKVLDLDGRLLSMNRSGQHLLEIDDIQPYLGQSWIDFWQNDNRAQAASAVAAARAGGIGKFRAFRPSFKGAPRWWDVIITPMLDAEGRPERLMAVSRDVTERKQAEAEREQLLADQMTAREQLEAERLRLQTILQHLPVGVLIAEGGSTRRTLVNEQAERILGAPLSVGDRIGEKMGHRIQRSDGSVCQPDELPIMRSLRTGETVSNEELVVARSDGERRIIVANAAPIRDSEGRIRDSVVILTDITERKRAETALHQSQLDLNRAQAVAHTGSWRMDVQHNRLLWSDETYRIFNIPPGTPLTYETFLAAIHPEDREHVDQQWLAALAGAPYDVEHRIIAGGGIKWVRERAELEFGADGALLGGFGTVQDITGRKEIEQQLGAANVTLAQAQAHLQHVLDSLFAFMGVTTPDGVITYINRAILEVSGLRWEEVVGRSFHEVGWWAHSAEVRRRMFDAMERARRGETVRFDTSAQVAGGRQIEIDLAIAPMLDEQGRVTHLIPSAVEITERKRAENALRQSEEQYRTLMETIPQMVWTIRPDGRHDFCNHYWHEYTGLSLEETIFNGWARALHPDEAPWAMAAWRSAFEAGQPMEAEGRLRRVADGAYRWHHTRIFPIRDADGRIVRWIGTAVDIHDRHLASEALHEANERLAAADRQKDEFLAMLAHELRNPLAPIRNAAHILRAIGSQDPKVQRQHDVIDRQVAHMAHLLDDLLDVSRVTRGKIELQRRSVPLGEVLSRSVEAASPLLQARRHTLHFSLPPVGLHIEGDFDRLIQIVGNLLNNAAKYTEEGGQIWLEANREGEQAVIRVRDTGVGIAPDLLPRVFDLFVQADRSLAREQGGLGIGLTMVRTLAELHGGTVEVSSEGRGKGSEFVVRLPALPEAEPEAEAGMPGPEAAPSAARACRVLVVDDVADSADSLVELLDLWGCEACAAHDGVSALHAAQSFQPQVVLLDIGMPGMDGNEVARRLRAAHGASVFLIALTGYGQVQDREATHAAGFDAHMVKPVDLAELRRLLHSSKVL